MDLRKAAMAALNGSAALAEYLSETAEHSTAMVVVPGEPPGKNTCEMIRHLIVDRTKLIVVAQPGRLAPGNFEKLLRASMPDVERKLRVMDAGESLAAAVNTAEANKLYSPGQALEVYCDEQQARNFAQEIRDGDLKFDPTVINVHPQQEMAKDDPDDILKACHDDDLDAMHRVLDPHIFSSHESLSEYQAALFGGGGQTEGLFTVGGESQSMKESVNEDGSNWADLNEPEDADERFGVNQREAAELITKFRDKLLKRGINVPEHPHELGAGTRGVAFDIGGNKVLKLTGDESEAKASSLMMKNPREHLVHVFDVFQFPKDGTGPVYGIVKEKLTPLSPTEAEQVSASGIGNHVGQEDMDRELRSIGINGFCDWNDGNIMKRGNTFVLVDPGYSNPQGGETPMLEQFIRQQAFSVLENLHETRDKVISIQAAEQRWPNSTIKMDHDLPTGHHSLYITADGADLVANVKGQGWWEWFSEVKPDGAWRHRNKELGVGGPNGKPSHERTSQHFKTWAIWNSWEGTLYSHRAQTPEEAADGYGIDAVGGQRLSRIRPMNGYSEHWQSGDVDVYDVSTPDKKAKLAQEMYNWYNEHGDPDDVFDDIWVSAFHGEHPPIQRRNESVVREFWSDVAPSKEVGIACVHDLLRQIMGAEAFELLEYLGSGRNGSAYRTPEGLILKVTTDMTEVGSALRLLGKKSQHISHIYAVQPIGDPPGLIYAILQEGDLVPLPPAYVEELDQACEVLEVAGAMYDLEVGDLKAMMGTLMDCTDPELGLMAAETLGRFGVAGMCRELKDLGLKADFHSGNIMLRDGHPVLTDLGTPGDDTGLSESLTEAANKTINLANAEKKFPNSTTLMDKELPSTGPVTLMVTPDGELVANVKGGGWYQWAPPDGSHGIPDGNWSKRTKDAYDFFNKGAEHGKPSIQRQMAGEHKKFFLVSHDGGPLRDNTSELVKAQTPEEAIDQYCRNNDLQQNPNQGGTPEKMEPHWPTCFVAHGYMAIGLNSDRERKIAAQLFLAMGRANGMIPLEVHEFWNELDANYIGARVSGTRAFGPWPLSLTAGTTGEQKTGQGDGDRIDEFGSGSPGSGAVGPATMRSSNSSSWSGGRGAILEPQSFVPEDENASERDGALDQDIRGAGLNWGNRRNTSSI